MKLSLIYTLTVLYIFVCTGHGRSDVPEIDWAHPMYSKLNGQQKKLLAEYRNNYIKLTDFYNNVAMDVAETKVHFFERDGQTLTFRSDPILDYANSWKYLSNGNVYFLLQCRHDRGYPPDNAGSVFIVSPKMNYLLRKSNIDAKHYSIVAKRQHLTDDDPAVEDAYFPFAAYSEDGVKLEYLLFQKPQFAKKYEIENIFPSSEKGIKTIVVTASAIGLKDGKIDYRFSFLPDRFWVLDEITVQLHQDKVTRKMKNSYFPFETDKVPLLKSYVYESFSEEHLTVRREYTVTQIISGPVPLEEFDVYQFLPPKVKIGEVTPAFPIGRVVGIIIGVILILFGIYLKFRDKKKG